MVGTGAHSCEERPRERVLFSLEKALGGHLIAAPQYIWGGCREYGGRLFTDLCDRRKRDHGHKLIQVRFWLGVRKNIHCKEDKHRSGFPRVALGFWDLWSFSRPTGQSLSSVVWIHCGPALSRRLDCKLPKVPSGLNESMIYDGNTEESLKVLVI